MEVRPTEAQPCRATPVAVSAERETGRLRMAKVDVRTNPAGSAKDLNFQTSPPTS